jgi:hypothetical protein
MKVLKQIRYNIIMDEEYNLWEITNMNVDAKLSLDSYLYYVEDNELCLKDERENKASNFNPIRKLTQEEITLHLSELI